MIKILIAYAEQFNLDYSAALHSAGIEPAILKNSEARVPSQAFNVMWLEIAETVNDPHPGLSFGRMLARNYPAGSILFTMMANCSSIGDALLTFVRYHRIMADTLQPVIERDDNTVSLSWQISEENDSDSPYPAEALLCIFHTIIRTLSQDCIVPRNVCFKQSPPKNTSEYRQFFRCEPVFDAPENKLVIDAADLNLKIRLANPALYEMLEKQADRIADSLKRNQTWPDKVVPILSNWILAGKNPNISTVAAELAVSVRTLQDRLKSEKTNFRSLLQTVRKQIAMNQLATTDMSICDVAFLLSYSEQSAFNRIFKRWTGLTPKNYRQKIRHHF